MNTSDNNANNHAVKESAKKTWKNYSDQKIRLVAYQKGKLSSACHDPKVKITLAVKTGDKPLGLDAKAMKAGFSPCVIHSLDVAHMMKTMAYCRAKGIRSFATIHDSNATHATNMTVMSGELRRAFVDI